MAEVFCFHNSCILVGNYLVLQQIVVSASFWQALLNCMRLFNNQYKTALKAVNSATKIVYRVNQKAFAIMFMLQNIN